METKTKPGKIFTVRFIKKDGTVRAMNCRTGVTSKLKGGELAYDPSAKGLKVVYDIKANDYRMVNINTVYELVIQGKRFLNESAKAKLLEL